MYAIEPGASALEGISPDLHEVPSVLLNEWIVRGRLGIDLSKPEDQKKVRYVKYADELVPVLKEKKGLGFWLRPLRVPDVLKVTQAGHVLPQKSTFFYPKVMSGFVFHVLD